MLFIRNGHREWTHEFYFPYVFRHLFLNAILKCIHISIDYFMTKYLTYLIKNINPYLKNNCLLIRNKILVIPLKLIHYFKQSKKCQ